MCGDGVRGIIAAGNSMTRGQSRQALGGHTNPSPLPAGCYGRTCSPPLQIPKLQLTHPDVQAHAPF